MLDESNRNQESKGYKEMTVSNILAPRMRGNVIINGIVGTPVRTEITRETARWDGKTLHHVYGEVIKRDMRIKGFTVKRIEDSDEYEYTIQLIDE